VEKGFEVFLKYKICWLLKINSFSFFKVIFGVFRKEVNPFVKYKKTLLSQLHIFCPKKFFNFWSELLEYNEGLGLS